jgi:hypothetical protein
MNRGNGFAVFIGNLYIPIFLKSLYLLLLYYYYYYNNYNNYNNKMSHTRVLLNS